MYLSFVLRSAKAKNERQKEGEVPLKIVIDGGYEIVSAFAEEELGHAAGATISLRAIQSAPAAEEAGTLVGCMAP